MPRLPVTKMVDTALALKDLTVLGQEAGRSVMGWPQGVLVLQAASPDITKKLPGLWKSANQNVWRKVVQAEEIASGKARK